MNKSPLLLVESNGALPTIRRAATPQYPAHFTIFCIAHYTLPETQRQPGRMLADTSGDTDGFPNSPADAITSVSAANAAVSARRIRGPSETTCHPRAAA